MLFCGGAHMRAEIMAEVQQGLASKLLARPSMQDLLNRHILRFGDVQVFSVEGKGEYERRCRHIALQPDLTHSAHRPRGRS